MKVKHSYLQKQTEQNWNKTEFAAYTKKKIREFGALLHKELL